MESFWGSPENGLACLLQHEAAEEQATPWLRSSQLHRRAIPNCMAFFKTHPFSQITRTLRIVPVILKRKLLGKQAWGRENIASDKPM